MNKIIWFLFFLCTCLIISILLQNLKIEEYKITPSLPQLITFYSQKYDVNEKLIRKVIRCESRYKTDAVGDGGKSYGLVQIHLPSHPYVSKEQAFDPDFALDFLAKNVAEGKGKMWTCYRRYIG